MRIPDAGGSRNAEFAAEIEQIMLHIVQALAHRVGQCFGEQHAECAVQFVHRADGLDAQTDLGYARTVAESGGAGVAGAGVDLGQAVPHVFKREQLSAAL